jgi:polysaccharide export outer membrane protein
MNNRLNTYPSSGFAEMSTMRNPVALLIVVIGLLGAGGIRAQQPRPNTSAADESNAKPCVVAPCVTVFGAVRAPAQLELRRRVRLAEVFAMAGGVTGRASGTVKVTHADSDSPGKSYTYVLSEVLRLEDTGNPYVEGGDIVFVTELDPIYVIGSVLTQREIYPKEPLTLTQAIKLAGGARRNAQISRVVIHRQDKGFGLSIRADLVAIRKHHTEDPILQPYDIVDVPPSGLPHVGPPFAYPTFDSRPLIPLPYRIYY